MEILKSSRRKGEFLTLSFCKQFLFQTPVQAKRIKRMNSGAKCVCFNWKLSTGIHVLIMYK